VAIPESGHAVNGPGPVHSVARAAAILRGAEPGYKRVFILLHAGDLLEEALATWLEHNAGSERAAQLAADICAAEDQWLDAYLRYTEGGR